MLNVANILTEITSADPTATFAHNSATPENFVTTSILNDAGLATVMTDVMIMITIMVMTTVADAEDGKHYIFKNNFLLLQLSKVVLNQAL